VSQIACKLLKVKKALKSYYRLSLFRPTWLGIFSNPFYLSRVELYKAMESTHSVADKILDVGCGQKPYEHLFSSKSYVGVEYDSPLSRKHSKADYFYDGQHLPFEDESFDLVLCNQVLEHVFNPKTFLNELNRVLALGGRIILTVPFVWDEHEQPNDFGRYTSFGLTHLMKENGFEVTYLKKLNPGLRGIFQLLSGIVFKSVPYNAHFFLLPLTAFINILGILSKMLPLKNNDFYLDNFLVAKKSST
jgi:SAM-dependent methyltransferase